MPSVISLTHAPLLKVSLKRTLKTTISPAGVPSSWAMRLAVEDAAMRRGCVCPIRPVSPRPSSRQIFGSCVVLPEPVSPDTITTWFFFSASAISCRRPETGNSSGKVIGGSGLRAFTAAAAGRTAREGGAGCGAGRAAFFLEGSGADMSERIIMRLMENPAQFVEWLRSAAPYVHAFRGKTFVVAFPGELVMTGALPVLAHDLSLLHALGIKVVIVFGSWPQVEEQLVLCFVVGWFLLVVRFSVVAVFVCVLVVVGVLCLVF